MPVRAKGADPASNTPRPEVLAGYPAILQRSLSSSGWLSCNLLALDRRTGYAIVKNKSLKMKLQKAF